MSPEFTHTPPPEVVQLSEILATDPVTVRVVAGVLMVRERERSSRLPDTVSPVAYVAVWSPWIRSAEVARVEVFDMSRALPVVRAVAEMPDTLVFVTVESMSNWASGVASPMPTLALAKTVIASVPAAETWKGFNVEPDAVVRFRRYPVPVLFVVSVRLNRLDAPVVAL